MQTEGEKVQQICLTLPRDLKKEIQVYAYSKGYSVSGLVRSILKERLDNERHREH